MLIVFNNRHKLRKCVGLDNWKRLQNFILFLAILSFPISGFVLTVIHQYKLTKLYRRRQYEAVDALLMKEIQDNRSYLASESAIAAKAVEVSTETSFQPVMQFYILVTGCRFIQDSGIIFTEPRKALASDLYFSVVVSLVTFAWSMTFHHVVKDGMLDIRVHIFPRIILFLSFFLQIANRMTLICLFGHQVHDSENFHLLLYDILIHLGMMLVFNIIFSDLPFACCKHMSYWLEMFINSCGCMFVHYWIKIFVQMKTDTAKSYQDIELERFISCGSRL